MRRAVVPTLVLFALLSVGAVAAVPPVTDTQSTVTSVEPGNGTVGQLSLPGDGTTTSGQQGVDADLSSTLAVDRERLNGQLTAASFEERFAIARNESEQLSVVRNEVEDLTATAIELRGERADAVRAFNRDELTDRALFRELARTATAATGVQKRAETVRTVTDGTVSLPADVSERLSGVDAAVVSFDGELTDRVVDAIRGDRPSMRLSLRTADSGIVLGTLDSGTYLREATLWSANAERGVDEFETSEGDALVAALDRARSVYSGAFDMVSDFGVSKMPGSAIYPVSLNHAHGELDAYFDGRTTDVFFEEQRLVLSRLPTAPLVSNHSDPLTIAINETGVNRPLSVTVTDVDSGEPVAATISAGNETLGTTGPDGQLWVLPELRSETVTATADGNTVSVTIEG